MTTTTQGSEESSNTSPEPHSDSLEHWIKDIRTDLSNDPPDWAPGDSIDGTADPLAVTEPSLTEAPPSPPAPAPELPDGPLSHGGGSCDPAEVIPGASAELVPGAPGELVPGAPAETAAALVVECPPRLAPATGANPVVPEPVPPMGMPVGPGPFAAPLGVPAGPAPLGVPGAPASPAAPNPPRVGRHRAPDPDDE